MRILFIIGFSVLVTFAHASEDFPDNIKYIKGSTEINEEARQMLINAFETKNFKQVFGGKVICGPSLWASIKGHPVLKGVKLAETTFNIPITKGTNAGEFHILKGSLFQFPEEISLLSSVFESLVSSKITVRKINSNEARIYWGLIPYDIEEPVYAIDFGEFVFLMDINTSDKKVFWVDELSRYSNG